MQNRDLHGPQRAGPTRPVVLNTRPGPARWYDHSYFTYSLKPPDSYRTLVQARSVRGARGPGPLRFAGPPAFLYFCIFRPRLPPMDRAGPCCKIVTLRGCTCTYKCAVGVWRFETNFYRARPSPLKFEPGPARVHLRSIKILFKFCPPLPSRLLPSTGPPHAGPSTVSGKCGVSAGEILAQAGISGRRKLLRPKPLESVPQFFCPSPPHPFK